MPTPAAAGRRSRRQGTRPTELPNAIEGQVAELCRELAVEVKRLRQLQEQADELRKTIRQWAGHSESRPHGDIN